MTLLISQLTNSILIQRYAEEIASKAVSKLSAQEKKIRKLIDIRLPVILGNEYDLKNRSRIKQTSKRISELLFIAMREINEELDEDIDDLLEEQIGFQKESYLKATYGKLSLVGHPKSKTLKEVKLDPFIAGATIWSALRAIPKRREEILNKEFSSAVHFATKESEVKKRIFGTAIKDSGIIGNAKRNVRTIVRTTVNESVNALKKNIALANGVESYIFYAILDSRTSEICAANAGLRFRFDNPEAPIPPLHPNCRSTIIFDVPEIKDKNTEQSYDEWLSEKPAPYQDKILGPTKGKLFRDGNFKMKDFVSSDFRPITIAELREANRKTFDELGLE